MRRGWLRRRLLWSYGIWKASWSAIAAAVLRGGFFEAARSCLAIDKSGRKVFVVSAAGSLRSFFSLARARELVKLVNRFVYEDALLPGGFWIVGCNEVMNGLKICESSFRPTDHAALDFCGCCASNQASTSSWAIVSPASSSLSASAASANSC